MFKFIWKVITLPFKIVWEVIKAILGIIAVFLASLLLPLIAIALIIGAIYYFCIYGM